MLNPIFKITADPGLVMVLNMHDIVSISYSATEERLKMVNRGRDEISEIHPISAGNAATIIERYIEVHGEGTE